MKKLTKLLALFLVLLSIFAFTACQDKDENTDTDVVITVSADNYDVQGKTLKDYMDCLVADGKLQYVISDGMITSLNGEVANGVNAYWMLYTDDAENSNSTWGTYEKDGKTYASAALGATDLPIKDGCTYVFTLQSF